MELQQLTTRCVRHGYAQHSSTLEIVLRYELQTRRENGTENWNLLMAVASASFGKCLNCPHPLNHRARFQRLAFCVVGPNFDMLELIVICDHKLFGMDIHE